MLFSRGVAGRENRRPEFRQIANGLASHQIQSSEIKSAKKLCEKTGNWFEARNTFRWKRSNSVSEKECWPLDLEMFSIGQDWRDQLTSCKDGEAIVNQCFFRRKDSFKTGHILLSRGLAPFKDGQAIVDQCLILFRQDTHNLTAWKVFSVSQYWRASHQTDTTTYLVPTDSIACTCIYLFG